MEMNTQKTLQPRVLGVVGATASGKTALSIALAQALGGEILSFDSMQVYRGMDIGTATPTAKERAAAVHHFIDIKQPWESYSCADFVGMARETIDELSARGVVPVLCGGTGLYLDGLLCGGAYESAPPTDEALRQRLLERAAKEDPETFLDNFSSFFSPLKFLFYGLAAILLAWVSIPIIQNLKRKVKNESHNQQK